MKPQARHNWQDQWAAQPRRAMLFDLDGTLLDSAPDLAKAANVLRQRSGLAPMPVEELRPWVSQGARGMITKGLNIPVDHPEYEPLRLAFLDIYSECLADNTDFWPGMDEVVDALDAQNIAWGIVTNKVMRFTEPLLKQINLWDRCAVVVGGDTTPHAKPHPAPMVHAIEMLALPPQAVVYVGDDARDIESGYAAGTWTIGCDFGHHVQAPWPREWGADAVVKQAQDLIRLL
ncbi:HAD-IA family hydrolase [beta proteobacterium MWH-UniP1]